MIRKMRQLLLLAIAALLAGCGERGGHEPAGKVVLRVNLDPVAKGLELSQKLAAEHEQRTGVRIEIIRGPVDATERLSQYFQYLGAQSEDIDIYQIDVIWPGLLAEHMIDLGPAFRAELPEFFAPIVQNNTVNGKLVAIPWFGDAGMLYYRTDLLKKYGFQSPPETWDQLEEMSQRIQHGERIEGHRDFWGYVWQGKAYEGLTCNAIEWLVSHGGGTVIKAGPKVTINNPQAKRALERAAGWVGSISPPGVTAYQEEEARRIFQQGNAAFMRNWPYAYVLAQGDDSAVHGKVDVTLVPSGGARHAAALGGWQLGVSRYSRHQKEAIEFVRYMVSEEVQKRRAIDVSLLPSRMKLYDDAELAAKIPFIPKMKDVFINASPRPSTASGQAYNEVSTRFFQAVHKVLTRQEKAGEALEKLETRLERAIQ